MSNLHDAVLELIETQSLSRHDYETVWEMYDDVNFDTHIDMLIDEHLYQTRDALVKWVCDGNLEYLDMACEEMACEEDAEDDEMILLQDAHMLYLQYVAYNTVFVVYAYAKE